MKRLLPTSIVAALVALIAIASGSAASTRHRAMRRRATLLHLDPGRSGRGRGRRYRRRRARHLRGRRHHHEERRGHGRRRKRNDDPRRRPGVDDRTFGAATEPTVSISGVTITGGVTTSSPSRCPSPARRTSSPRGGGIEVPPAASFSPGATVTISEQHDQPATVPHPTAPRRRSARPARPGAVRSPAQSAAASTPGGADGDEQRRQLERRGRRRE